ncbi:MAG: leukotoxin LktA family filamentous adhesin, partial [Deltaproteobacteria bacterium]|nr:leukotoxin LktA family filamentous adhesin [Deltaproteobacteria bacterium]
MRRLDSSQSNGVFFKINSSKRKGFVVIFTLCQFFFANFAWAANIVIDGNTATNLSVTNNITNITTATVRGNTAFNSFSTFNVNPADVVNLHLPGSTLNLMNLVNSQTPTSINGILNSIKNGQIGGNVYFANPRGLIVGNAGVVNVGALTVLTPTQSFMDDFFSSPGNPVPGSVDMLMNGTAPIDGTGLISIQGKVNAIGAIDFSAGNVNNAGTIASGASFSGTAPDFSDVVNVNDLQSASKIDIVGGDIYIRAVDDVTSSGVIVSNGVV